MTSKRRLLPSKRPVHVTEQALHRRVPVRRLGVDLSGAYDSNVRHERLDPLCAETVDAVTMTQHAANHHDVG